MSPALAAPAIAAVLARGINMDHLFDPYRDPVKRPWEPADRERIAGRIKAEEFALVANLGFRHVRLNLGQVFLQESSGARGMRAEGLELLDRALDLAATHKLALILDLHQIPVPDYADPAQYAALRTVWRTLAKRYAGREQTLLFELLNEPRIEDADRWREIVRELIGDIRAEDPNRWVVVTGAEWGGAENLIKMGNLRLPNLVYTYHWYDPFVFTHQGATWTGEELRPLRGIRYPIDPDQMRAGTGWPFNAWKDGGGKDEIAKRMRPVLDFGKKEGLLLYCGEFGVHKPHAPPADRARWIADMVSILNANAVGWAMWAYHAGFDLVEKDGTPTPAVVKALGLKL